MTRRLNPPNRHHEYTFAMLGGLLEIPFEFDAEFDRIFQFIEGTNLSRSPHSGERDKVAADNKRGFFRKD